MLKQGRQVCFAFLCISLLCGASFIQPCSPQKSEGTEAQVASVVRRARGLLRARDTVDAVALLEQAKQQFPDALFVRYLLSAAYFCRAVTLEDALERPERESQIRAALLDAVRNDRTGEFSQPLYTALLRDSLQSTRQTVAQWAQGVLRRERLFAAAEREARHILERTDDADTKILWAWLNAYRALAAADWARSRSALLQSVESSGRPLTLQERQCVTMLDAQKTSDFSQRAVQLFLQVLRLRPHDPAIHASFADCLSLLCGAKGTLRSLPYLLPRMDTSRVSPSAPRSHLPAPLDTLSEEQVVSSPERYVQPLYERAMALDQERHLPSARYGLTMALMRIDASDFAEAEKILENLRVSAPQNALYQIDRALLTWGRDRPRALELLRSATRATTFRRELLTTAPRELIATLGASQRVNDLLHFCVGNPYRCLFSEINRDITRARTPRERISQLFFKISLAERFMQSHYRFDQWLGVQEKSAALHQLLALAPYLTPLEASALRSKIFNFELTSANVKPAADTWVLSGGGLWRGNIRDADAFIRQHGNGSGIIAFYYGGSVGYMQTIK